MSFLDGIGRQNLLKFWLHVEGFKSCADKDGEILRSSFENLPGLELSKDAVHIYETYITEKCHHQICLPPDLYAAIEELLNSDASLVDNMDCFDPAQRFVWDELKHGYFKQFLESPCFLAHKIEIYKAGSLQLADILQDHQLLRLFADVSLCLVPRHARNSSLWSSRDDSICCNS